MLIFSKQAIRKSLSTSFLVLLLILSVLILSIGFSAWQGTNKQFDIIDEQYTTIGIHSGKNYDMFYSVGHSSPTGMDSTLFEDGSVYYGPIDANKHAEKASSYQSGSRSVLLSAYVENMTALTSGTMNILDYIHSHDSHCYNLAVFAVECLSIKQNEEPFLWDGYTMEARVIDNVSLMNAYNLPPENDILIIQTSLFTEDGEIPFEVGKQYLIRGRYWDYTIDDLGYQTVTDESGNEVIQFVRGRDIEHGTRYLELEGDSSFVDSMSNIGRNTGVQNFIYDIHKDMQTGLLYFSTPKTGCWPYYAMYEGDWMDFLTSDAGTVWREEIIPNFEINHASAPVILTDNVNSMYLFNTGDASIMEGRHIEATEYKNGTAVCLISASYAKLNSLDVGDTISLDYYNTGYEQSYCVISSINSKSSLTIERKPLTEDTRMGIKKDYTIVGIYTAPEWTPGVQNFHADTIFVPKASVPGADQIVPFMSDSMNAASISMLNSIIIKNGSIAEFEAHMAENGMSGVYLYFDQGYSEAAASVQTLINNSMRLMLVGITMFGLASLLFLLLFIRRTEPVTRTMRLLGVSIKKTWNECFATLLLQELIAVIFGNILAVLLYDRITKQFLASIPALSINNVAFCGLIQFLLLVATGGIWTHHIATRNLMQKG